MYKSVSEKFNISEAIVKKYVIFIKDKKPLLMGIDTYRPLTLIENEDKALNILV